jgi:hypothetical protein
LADVSAGGTATEIPARAFSRSSQPDARSGPHEARDPASRSPGSTAAGGNPDVDGRAPGVRADEDEPEADAPALEPVVEHAARETAPARSPPTTRMSARDHADRAVMVCLLPALPTITMHAARRLATVRT